MKPCALYIRYSTDRQNERSVEDQEAVDRAYMERLGFTVVAVYIDRALSGASIVRRKEALRMIEDAKDGRFVAVCAETTSRYGRDEEDRAAMRKRLTFAGVDIMTTVDGIVTRMVDGFKAVMDAHQLDDLKVMIRRGMAGVIRSGRHAGGRAYGYRKVLGKPGELEIDADQVATVNRIFAEYAAGRSPRAIAHDLNRDHVPGPRKDKWNASTINGWGTRGAGILNNPIYIGRVVWNKNRMVLNPDTGRRVSRANPVNAWQTTEIPALAIVPPDLFERVRQRRAARKSTHPVHLRSPRHLFSSLLRCAACGSGMSAFGADRSGRRRIRCSRATESGTCGAPRTFYLDAVETLVLDTIKRELRQPDIIAEYVRTYHAARQRLARDAGKDRARLERRLSEIARETERAVDAICKGIGDATAIGARTKELAIERSDVERAIGELPAADEIIALHPATLDRYLNRIDELQQAFANGDRKSDGPAAAIIRELVETITVHAVPGEAGKLRIEIAGRLRALLGEQAFPNGSVGSRKLVAEDGFEPPTHGL
jgi:site-specific DNA recombinase